MNESELLLINPERGKLQEQGGTAARTFGKLAPVQSFLYILSALFPRRQFHILTSVLCQPFQPDKRAVHSAHVRFYCHRSIAVAALASICSMPSLANDGSVMGVVKTLIDQGSADVDAKAVTKILYSKTADECVKAYFNGNKPAAEKSFKELLGQMKDSYDTLVSVVKQMHGRVVMFSPNDELPKCYGMCMYESVVSITEKTLGPNHQAVGAALSFVAQYYEDRREFKSAITVRERQLKIFRRACGNDWHTTQTTLQNLAYDYFLLHDYKNAGRLLNENIAVCKRKQYTKELKNALRLQAEIAKANDTSH